MLIDLKLETLEALQHGSLTTAQAAAKLNLTEPEVARLQEVYELSQALAARNEAQRDRARSLGVRRLAVAAAAAVAIFVGLGTSAPAWAQTMCTQTLPSPMTTFCADSPATASSVNANFQQLATWMSQKVGTLGNANVTVTGTITATTVTATTSIVTPNANVNGPIYRGANLPATGDLGLYSQVSGNYMRFVTNAGPFFFFSDGAAGNNYAGATAIAGIDTAGNLSANGSLNGGSLNVSGQIAGGSIRQRNCNWGARGPSVLDDSSYHSVYCPAGQYMAGWQCKANGYLDGDCAAWCCSP